MNIFWADPGIQVNQNIYVYPYDQMCINTYTTYYKTNLEAVLSKYSHLKIDIYLCERQACSYGTQWQSRSVIPNADKNRLYIGLKNDSNWYPIDYFCHSIYHDMNHYLEYTLYRDYRHQIPSYTKLYIEGGGTSVGGETMQNFNSSELGRNCPDSFLNQYSMSGEWEDRSEIIAYILNKNLEKYAYTFLKTKYITNKNFKEKTDIVIKEYVTNYHFTNLSVFL